MTGETFSGKVFVSSGAFSRQSVEQILTVAHANRLNRIELASGTRHDCGAELGATLKSAVSRGFEFLVHNYFPVPNEAFVLNLASGDDVTLQRSLVHVRTAIDLAQAIGAPFYSVHCGFCIDPVPSDLGGPLTGRRIPVEQARRTFIESVRLLAAYAQSKGVRLLLENNVLAPVNLGRARLLGVTPEEIESLLDEIDRDNVGLLLDVAHLKVSAATLGFDAAEGIARLAPLIGCCHLSDNDGSADTNQTVSLDAWFWEPLLDNLIEPPTWVLEAYDLDVPAICEQLALIETRIAGRHSAARTSLPVSR